ncbi:hypothetical protein B0H11DRAFT_1910568 [Mycena galericulata]|nr:hypothetical protein B0H11DRAFT_1910568 [Mycena galericulata]
MARSKTGKAPGRASDFTGEKKTWLESFRDLLVEAGTEPGPVYTDVTNLFLLRYGFDLPFSQNVEGNPEDNPPPAGETVSPEEKARRNEIRAKLRVKLANWYRNRYRGKKVHAGTIKRILLSMQSMTGRGARPRRRPAVAMYSKLHYATRIKAGFDAKWEASITRYGRAAFKIIAKAECMNRAWPPVDGVIPPAPEGLLSMNDAASGPAVGSVQPTAGTAAPPTAPSNIATSGASNIVTSSDAAASTASASGPEAVVPAVVNDEHNNENINNEDPPADDGIDRSEWEESLVGAHAYLSKKSWGTEWEALVQSLVEFEWSHYHLEENGKLPKGQCRPVEFAKWMKEHRQFIDYRVEKDFGARLLAWWKELGPPTRWDGVGDKEGEEKEPSREWKRFWTGEWSRLRSTGRNGPMLLILGLAWWGQTIWNAGAADGLGGGDAALAAAADWQLLVKDVHGVITGRLTQGRAAMDAQEPEDTDMEGSGEETAERTEKTAGAKRGKGKEGKTKTKTKTGPAKPKAAPAKKAKAAATTTRKRKRGVDEEEDTEDPSTAAPKSQKKNPEVEEERPRPKRMTRESARARIALGVGEMSPPTTTSAGLSTPSTTSGLTATVPATTTAAEVDNSRNTVGNTVEAEAITASKNTPPVPNGNSALSPAVISAVAPATADRENTGPVRMDEDDAEESLLRSKPVDPADIDPFAELEGLTPEERAEMELDPDADLEDDDDEDEDE